MSARDTARALATGVLRHSGAMRLATELLSAPVLKAPRARLATASLRRPPDPRAPIALVAHHSATPHLEPSFLHLLGALRQVGAEVLVVSTCPGDHNALVATCPDSVFAVLTRENRGFDFASWATAIDWLRSHGWLERPIWCVNSSMFGPLWSLSEIHDQHIARQDMWALTESRELVDHMQSYMFGFSADVVQSEPFAKFWASVRDWRSKWLTIITCELTWASRIGDGTYRAQALVPASVHGCARNPLTQSWRTLIAEFGLPFVKKSLFDQNYDRIDMRGAVEFLRDVADDFDVDCIEPEIARRRSGQ